MTDKPPDVFTEAEVDHLGHQEHDRWTSERLAAGWTAGPRDAHARTSSYLMQWEELDEDVREVDRQFVRACQPCWPTRTWCCDAPGRPHPASPTKPEESHMSHDVFICHSSKDRILANAICAKLEANQIRCWIAPRDVVPGIEYAQSIIEAIGATHLTVLVFSQNANQSPHVHRELERTASHGIPILPFRVEDVAPAASVEYFISDAHWLDALTPPMETHLDYLVGTVRLILDREAAKTSGQPMPASPDTATAPPVAAPRLHRTMRYAVLAALALVVVAALVIVGVVALSGDTTGSTSTPAPSTPGPAVATTTGPAEATTTGPAVATFTGTQDQMTAPFTVGSPWRLSWTVSTSYDSTPLVVVVDAASGDYMEVLDAITKGSGSQVIDQVCTSCTLEITVYGPTTYTFTVTDGA